MDGITGLSEEPTLRSDSSTGTLVVEPVELKHVFISSVAGQTSGTLLVRVQTIRVESIPLILAADAHGIDQDKRIDW